MYIKLKPSNDIVQDMYNTHTSYHEGDSGLDLYVVERIVIPKDSLENTINFGISCEAFAYKETARSSPPNMSYYLYPRSSISKTPLRMSNSVGIIDAGYRGSIIAKVDNLDRENDYVIEVGTRLFQLCSPNLSTIEFEVVNTLSETSRGNGGFGSTGF